MATPIISADPQTGQPMVALDISPNTINTSLVGDAGTAISKLFRDNIADVESTRANVLRWGFVGDRTTDNTSAFDDLIAYLKTLTVRPAIYFPAGFYLFGTQPVFDIPGIKVVGDGMDASFLVSNAGTLFSYPNPVIQDIGVSPVASPSVSTGIELRNCWQASLKNVSITNFAIGCHLKLDDEGQGLIPGNTPGGPYPVGQFTRHTSWPTMDEFVRDSLTTTEHWGSRISISLLDNLHIIGRESTDVGIKLENTVADPTTSYDDNHGLSGSAGQGQFFTGTNILNGHILAEGKSIHIGGGVHGVKIKGTYCDIHQEGIRLDYGAQSVEIENVNLDIGGNYAINWLPETAYAEGDTVRVGDREYTVASGGDGTSAANINHNGVPNSEFVSMTRQLVDQPVVGANNTDNQLTQAQPFGVDFLSTNVKCFVQGVSVINGVRWLNLASYLPSVTGSSETLNIWFGNHGRANLFLDVANGDLIQAGFDVQHRDPRIADQPAMVGRIRASNSSGALTEQSSSGENILAESGFLNGSPVSVAYSYTMTDPNSIRASPFIAITYSPTQSGWFPFRVAVPQINKGVSLGSYVRTYGRPRSRWQDGPQGTGTGITDGTVTWDYSGTPRATIIAVRQAWQVGDGDTGPELIFNSHSQTAQPLPEVLPPPHYFCVLPNPANSNGHPTTLED